jgi:hypothetical protein
MPFLYEAAIVVAFLAIVALAYIGALRQTNRSAWTEADKRFGRRYLTLFVAVFLAGATARLIQQQTGSVSLDGLVGVLIGVLLCLLGLPALYRASRQQDRGLKFAFLVIVGFTPIPIGLIIVWIGARRLATGQF